MIARMTSQRINDPKVSAAIEYSPKFRRSTEPDRPSSLRVRTGLRPVPLDETGDATSAAPASWPGIARRRTGVLLNALCPGHPRRAPAPRSPILLAPCRPNIWGACKPDHVDGGDKPGHDGKCHGNQRLRV